jgi:hypothetical protein
MLKLEKAPFPASRESTERIICLFVLPFDSSRLVSTVFVHLIGYGIFFHPFLS